MHTSEYSHKQSRCASRWTLSINTKESLQKEPRKTSSEAFQSMKLLGRNFSGNEFQPPTTSSCFRFSAGSEGQGRYSRPCDQRRVMAVNFGTANWAGLPHCTGKTGIVAVWVLGFVGTFLTSHRTLLATAGMSTLSTPQSSQKHANDKNAQLQSHLSFKLAASVPSSTPGPSPSPTPRLRICPLSVYHLLIWVKLSILHFRVWEHLLWTVLLRRQQQELCQHLIRPRGSSLPAVADLSSVCVSGSNNTSYS